jgi:hypothetical protein
MSALQSVPSVLKDHRGLQHRIHSYYHSSQFSKDNPRPGIQHFRNHVHHDGHLGHGISPEMIIEMGLYAPDTGGNRSL